MKTPDSPHEDPAPGLVSDQVGEPATIEESRPHADPGEFFETEIQKIVTGGKGLGRYEQRAAFVPLTAPGDRIRARIRSRKKSYVEAELTEILSAGPGRRDPPCPHYGECGGCDLQHLSGAAQRLAKTEIVTDCFRRLGKLEVAGLLAGPEPCGLELGYRNKIHLFASPTGHYGLRRRGSHEVVPLTVCLQMPDAFNQQILPWLRELPPVQEVVVRFDSQGGWQIALSGRPSRVRLLRQILADLPQNQAPWSGCRGILFNKLPAWGRDYLVMQIAGKKYRVGTQSFFQTNFAVCEEIVAVLGRWLDISRRATKDGSNNAGGADRHLLIDLFCGVGLFSLALSDRFSKVTAVDADPHAVHDARNNIDRDSSVRDKVSVIQASVDRYLTRGLQEPAAETASPPEEQWREACCLVDPPRAGLGARAAAALIKLSPREIFYLSCDPATLARDAALLVKAGYTLERLQAFDMFPQTAHLETMAQLVHR